MPTATLIPSRPRPAALARRLVAEALGTAWLVSGGCGTAVLAARAGGQGDVGLPGVALAFGLTVFTMACAVGPISGGHFNPAAFIVEFVLSFGFLTVILGATDGRSPAAFAPLTIGRALTSIHLVSIPITSTSVNPARGTGPALFVGGWAFRPLWLFRLAPIAGAAAAGVAGRWPFGHEEEDRLPGPIFDKPVEVLVPENNAGRSGA